MEQEQQTSVSAAGEDRRCVESRARAAFFLYATAALLLALATAFVYVRRGPFHSLFDLSFCVGQASWQLTHGGGFSCFSYPVWGHRVEMRAARMPVATLYVAAAARCLGPTQVMQATLFKAVLLLLPVLGAARMVLSRCASSKRLLLFAAAVLALPFLVPNFLADIVNLQVEEGFSFAFLAIAFTLVALGVRSGWSATVYTLATAAALDLLYLSKSSMIVAVVVLLLFSLVKHGPVWSRMLLLLLVAAAPFGWAVRQHRVSGRYAIGTSWDGGNLHKGNYEKFLLHYPPSGGANLDLFDYEIEPPHTLGDEWAYNDWHSHQAVLYIRSHPRETLIGWEKKFYVFFVSLHVYGYGSVVAPWPLSAVGMVDFRLLLFCALGFSVYALFWGDGRSREIGLLYLAVVAACALPYLVGFGYTRHASILIYPSAVALCLLSAARQRAETGGMGRPRQPAVQ